MQHKIKHHRYQTSEFAPNPSYGKSENYEHIRIVYINVKG